MAVDLHIEELVLHGFPPRDRHRIAEAVRLELTRLLSARGAQQGLAMASPASDRIAGGSFKVKADGTPQAAGQEIARAVFRSLRQSAGAGLRGGASPSMATES